MDVGSARQRIADTAADTGGRAAEGLDLGGVVVGLVLEHEQPVLLLAVHGGGDVDGAGVDLLALVQLGQQAAFFQGLGTDGGQIHQGLGPLGGLLLAIHLHPGGQIARIGGLDVRVGNVHGVDVGGEGGVAAVVGPVGVHQTHLGDGGVAPLLVPEVGLQELQVVQIHGKAQLGQQGGKAGLVQSGKAGDGGHPVGDVVSTNQGVGLVHVGLPALHRVDEVAADLVHVGLGQLALQQVHLGIGDQGAVHPRHELDALGAGVGTLVELAGQGLHRQHLMGVGGDGIALVIDRVHLGLGKHDALGLLIDGRVDLVGIVPVQDDHAFQAGDAKLLAQLGTKTPGLHVKAGLFLGVAAENTHVHSSICAGFSFFSKQVRVQRVSAMAAAMLPR